jgi:hypothetical protein
MNTLLAFLSSHQEVMYSVAVAGAGALFNWICRPRTSEEYLALPPRVAAFFKFMAAVFPDPKGFAEAVYQAWKNTHELPPAQASKKAPPPEM